MIRALRPDDRQPIRELLDSTGHFTAPDIDVALELVDRALSEGEASGYLIHVLTEPDGTSGGDVVRGYVCFGPTPMTDGTYDLYWIAVHVSQQGNGFGRALLRFAEEQVAQRGARLLLIETSSQASYSGTVRFYERSGYVLVARIADFYRVDDDKLVFAKRIRA